MRLETELNDLINFFKGNAFFKDFAEKNGIEALMDCYKCLKYQKIPKRKYVMKQGDYGDTYYIILKGKVIYICYQYLSKYSPL